MSWFADLLLESVAPPPSYLPSRRSKLAMGPAILRGGRGARGMRSARLRDIAPAHIVGASSRYVSGAEIAAEVEADLRTINPPVVQGWMVAVLAAGVLAFIGGLPWAMAMHEAVDRLGRGVVIASPIALSFILIIGANVTMIGLELVDDRVLVRRWIDHHLRRPGRDLGPALHVSGGAHGRRLDVSGPLGSVTLSMRWWPPSARLDAHDELPIWQGRVEVQVSRRAERARRHQDALERHRAEEEAHRHHT